MDKSLVRQSGRATLSLGRVISQKTFMEIGIYNHGRAIVRERRGIIEATRAQRFFDRGWGMFIVGAALVGMIWALWAQFSPRQYTMGDMRHYAIEYFNWAVKQ